VRPKLESEELRLFWHLIDMGGVPPGGTTRMKSIYRLLEFVRRMKSAGQRVDTCPSERAHLWHTKCGGCRLQFGT